MKRSDNGSLRYSINNFNIEGTKDNWVIWYCLITEGIWSGINLSIIVNADLLYIVRKIIDNPPKWNRGIVINQLSLISTFKRSLEAIIFCSKLKYDKGTIFGVPVVPEVKTFTKISFFCGLWLFDTLLEEFFDSLIISEILWIGYGKSSAVCISCWLFVINKDGSIWFNWFMISWLVRWKLINMISRGEIVNALIIFIISIEFGKSKAIFEAFL